MTDLQQWFLKNGFNEYGYDPNGKYALLDEQGNFKMPAGYDAEGNFSDPGSGPTSVWASKLGLNDPAGFAARANSGNLTKDDIQKIGQLSSVAPQMDANGRVTNAADFWSGAVTKAQDSENQANKGKFLGMKMDAGPADALNLGAAYLGGGYALSDAAPAAAGYGGAGDYAAANGGSVVAGGAGAAPAATSTGATDATLQSILDSSNVPTISQGVNVAGPTETAAGTFDAGNAANGLRIGAGGETGITAGTASETGAGLGSGVTSTQAGNVIPGGLGALSNDALVNAGLVNAGSAAVSGAGGAIAGGGLAGTLAQTGAGTLATQALPSGGVDTGNTTPTAPAPTPNGGGAGPDPYNGTIGAPNGTGGGVGIPNSVPTGIGNLTLDKLLNGDVGVDDLAKSLTLGDLGKILGTGLSAAGSNAQANALKDLNNQYMGITQPSRDRYEASFAPNFDINSLPGVQNAMDTSTQSLLRSLSTHGNPFGNPSGLADVLKYVSGNVALPALNAYRNQNASTGGFGAFSTAAPAAATGAIGQTGNIYSDIGRGIANITNPPSTLEQALRSLKSFP